MTMDKVPGNNAAGIAKIDTKLEVVVIPVANVDRSKEFYTKLMAARRRLPVR